MPTLIGEHLKSLRTSKELTQAEWVQTIGIANSNDVSRIENGRKSPSNEYLQAVANAFDKNLDTFMRMRDDEDGFLQMISSDQFTLQEEPTSNDVVDLQNAQPTTEELESLDEPLSDEEFKVQEIARHNVFAPYGATIELSSDGVTQSITINSKANITVYIHPD